nr:porin [Massilia sp. JS1662]
MFLHYVIENIFRAVRIDGKSLLLGMLGAVSAAASAQNAVNISGLIDVALMGERGGPNGAVTKISSGVFNGSRLIFSGKENLGDGLSAEFLLENGFQLDTGAAGQGGAIFGRQAFLGLKGSFGTVRVGRQYSAFDGVVGVSDPFGAGGAGRDASILGVRNVRGVTTVYTNRINNDVMYFSPVIHGFSADIAYGFGEVPGNIGAGRFLGASAGYQGGPLYVRAAFQDINNPAGTGSARNAIVGATYAFPRLTVHMAYAAGKSDDAGSVLSKDRDFLLGLTIPAGAGKFMASYVGKRDRVYNQNANLAAIGYMYFLSKRTRLYTAYGRIHNENGARFTIDTSVERGTGTRTWNVGMQHAF